MIRMHPPESVVILIDNSREAQAKWQESLKKRKELLRKKQLSLVPDLTAEDVSINTVIECMLQLSSRSYDHNNSVFQQQRFFKDYEKTVMKRLEQQLSGWKTDAEQNGAPTVLFSKATEQPQSENRKDLHSQIYKIEKQRALTSADLNIQTSEKESCSPVHLVSPFLKRVHDHFVDPQQGWNVATELPLVRDEGGGKIRSRSRSAAMSDSVKIRNARERERVKTLNFAYEKLRDRLPLTPGLRGKKLSKYETLQVKDI
jgi:hypothetical protein